MRNLHKIGKKKFQSLLEGELNASVWDKYRDYLLLNVIKIILPSPMMYRESERYRYKIKVHHGDGSRGAIMEK